MLYDQLFVNNSVFPAYIELVRNAAGRGIHPHFIFKKQ